MTIYSFYIFDRHCECIYVKQWHQRDRTFRPTSSSASTADSPVTLSSDRRSSTSSKLQNEVHPSGRGGRLSVQDDAKLVFGVVFSLRNMVRKLSGPDDSFISYRTGSYKLHYYETATNLKFVLLTDVKMNNLKVVLHQIYVNLYVEFVTKNPLSPIEHPGGEGVAVELFEMGLDSFIRTIQD
ncbi:Longin-like domain-containing protein [Tuber borchii]|uniref:Trafficking protein particle complex subunit n=1 Tax=Tuber borchii TaxID=42251 RepID=A0A2T6ZYI6_TUBBO|nr:Longin-like domain-containing protein [Tuber borchii]